LKWKVALLILTVFLAPVVTAVAVNLNTPKLEYRPPLEKTALCIISEPTGEPISGPHPPN